MNRRNFLGAILAAGSAPAIVKAESLMKIFVPKQELQIVGLDIYGCATRYKRANIGCLDIDIADSYPKHFPLIRDQSHDYFPHSPLTCFVLVDHHGNKLSRHEVELISNKPFKLTDQLTIVLN
jgi:hypothetical protein